MMTNNQHLSKIPISKFGLRLIEEILQYLDNNEIENCVMRNSHSIIDNFPKGDVDILVKNGIRVLRRLDKAIFRLQKEFGFLVYATSCHANVSRNYYISTTVGGKVRTINLEFFNEVFVYDHRRIVSKKYNYLDTSDILHSRVKIGQIYKCDADYELIFKVVDTLFNDKSKNFKWLDNEIPRVTREVRFQKIAERTIGGYALRLLRGFSWMSSSEESRLLLKGAILTFLRKNHAFPLTSGLLRDFWSAIQHAKQYLSPGGLLCHIMGTDGSGKTTLSDKFSKKRDRSFTKVHRIHLGNRPILLPSLRGEKNLGSNNQLSYFLSVNFHEYDFSKAKFSTYQTLRFLYITLDYILHYYLKLKFLMARGDIIITERYFFDYLIVPERYFPSVPTWIKKICSRIVPKPNCEIYVTVAMEEIIKRKQELPVKLLEYEIDSYREYALKRGVPLLSNSGALPKAVEGLEEILFSRTIRR